MEYNLPLYYSKPKSLILSLPCELCSHAEGIVFSIVCLCVHVCVCVNKTTLKLLDGWLSNSVKGLMWSRWWWLHFVTSIATMDKMTYDMYDTYNDIWDIWVLLLVPKFAAHWYAWMCTFLCHFFCIFCPFTGHHGEVFWWGCHLVTTFFTLLL